MRVVFICDGWIGLNVQFEMMTLTVNMFALQTNTLQVNEIANLKVEGQNKRELWAGSCARPDLSEQIIPNRGPPSWDKYAHIHHARSSPHKHSHASCCTLRVSDPYRAIKFILPLQTDNLIYGTSFWARISVTGRKETTQLPPLMASFHSCRPGMAPTCCLVSGSACFTWMMEVSGRLVSAGARRGSGKRTDSLMFSSCTRYSDDGCMFSGCEKRAAHKCSHLKQNMWPADIKLSSMILLWRMRGNKYPLTLIWL